MHLTRQARAHPNHRFWVARTNPLSSGTRGWSSLCHGRARRRRRPARSFSRTSGRPGTGRRGRPRTSAFVIRSSSAALMVSTASTCLTAPARVKFGDEGLVGRTSRSPVAGLRRLRAESSICHLPKQSPAGPPPGSSIGASSAPSLCRRSDRGTASVRAQKAHVRDSPSIGYKLGSSASDASATVAAGMPSWLSAMSCAWTTDSEL
jgi:hypothetical protein